jgi:hypothetical protein
MDILAKEIKRKKQKMYSIFMVMRDILQIIILIRSRVHFYRKKWKEINFDVVNYQDSTIAEIISNANTILF